MGASGAQWAAAAEVSNKSRLDVPSTYILKPTTAVCDDLGIAAPCADALVSDQHVLIKKFADHFKDPAVIDDGVPFRKMSGRGLYRIRAQHWRALVWADRGVGVVWLLRAVSLSKFQREEDAYDHLAGLGSGLFPTEDEIAAAADEQRLAHAVRALRDALSEAMQLPGTWHPARMRAADQRPGEGEIVGRTYVERESDTNEWIEERFLVAVTRCPASSVSSEEWAALVMARVFPNHPDASVPDFVDLRAVPGSHRPGVEFALIQEAWGSSTRL